MNEWKPTMELRFIKRWIKGEQVSTTLFKQKEVHILQQKWERGGELYHVDDIRFEIKQPYEFEWRDIPTIKE